MSGWQPIDTAPRDGTRLLVVWPATELFPAWVGISEFKATHGCIPHWALDGVWIPSTSPVWWMPLPAAPTGSSMLGAGA